MCVCVCGYLCALGNSLYWGMQKLFSSVCMCVLQFGWKAEACGNLYIDIIFSMCVFESVCVCVYLCLCVIPFVCVFVYVRVSVFV